jgi:histidinol-phosphatase
VTGWSLDDDLTLALRMADAADEIAMAGFTGKALAHETKADGSPVTDTDRAIEERLRTIVDAERPGDGFTGEEVGHHDDRNGRRWYVDGIDGTVLFVDGRTSWGTQIGLAIDGELVVGVRTNPAIRRRWWAARGHGAWSDVNGRGTESVRIQVSDRATQHGATFSVIPPIDRLRGAGRAAAERVAAVITYTEPVQHAALLVAEGTIDTGVQTSGGPWDFAALVVIVEEAGGRYSTPAGTRAIDEGGPVVFSNGHLHDLTVGLVRDARS